MRADIQKTNPINRHKKSGGGGGRGWWNRHEKDIVEIKRDQLLHKCQNLGENWFIENNTKSLAATNENPEKQELKQTKENSIIPWRTKRQHLH